MHFASTALFGDDLIPVVVDEWRKQCGVDDGRADLAHEVTVLLAMSGDYLFSWVFWGRPDAAQYRLAMIALAAEFNARLGVGRWLLYHDMASYSVTAEVKTLLAELGVKQSEAFSRLPQDQQPIELLNEALRAESHEPGTFDWLKLLSVIRDAIDAANDPSILQPLVDSLMRRLQTCVILGGDSLPRKLLKPGGFDPGLAIVTELRSTGPPIPPERIAELAAAVRAHDSFEDLALRFQLRPLDIRYFSQRVGFFGTPVAPTWEGCVVLGILPARDGTPMVIFTDAFQQFFHVARCDTLGSFPKLLAAVRQFAIENWPLIAVGRTTVSGEPAFVVESCPGGELFTYAWPARDFSIEVAQHAGEFGPSYPEGFWGSPLNLCGHAPQALLVTDDDAAAAMALRDAPMEVPEHNPTMRLRMTPEGKLTLEFLDSHGAAGEPVPVVVPEPLPWMASGDAPSWLGPHPSNDLAARIARLKRLVTGLVPESRERDRLIDVGNELLRIQASGEPMPNWGAIAGNARVDGALVVGVNPHIAVDLATQL
jgi:hypothetical protein